MVPSYKTRFVMAKSTIIMLPQKALKERNADLISKEKKINDNMLLTKEQKPFVRRVVNKTFFRSIKFLPRASSAVAASLYSDMVDGVVDQAGIGISGDEVALFVKDIKKQIQYFTCQKRNTVVQQLQLVVKSKYFRAGLLSCYVLFSLAVMR